MTNLNGQGPPLWIPSIANFQEIAMDQQAGGPVAGSIVPGFWTGQRTDCVVVAAMQHNGLGQWMSYYFAHLRGGLWNAGNQMLFNRVITNPLATYIAMNSNAFAGLEILLAQMNAGNPSGAIPEDRLLQYKSPNPTFALRLSDASIGQIPG